MQLQRRSPRLHSSVEVIVGRRYALAYLLALTLCLACGTGKQHGTGGPAATAAHAPAGVPSGVAVAPSREPTSVSVPTGGQNQRGYLGQYDDGVLFIQWTDSNGTLSGQLQQVAVDAATPFTPKATNVAFTGVRSGSSISLSFPAGFGVSTTWTGTVNGDTLTLVTSERTGFLHTSVLHAATVDDYNRAVVAFSATLQQRQQQAQAAAVAASQQAIASACTGRTVGAVGHDMTVTFSGRDATLTCTQFLSGNPPNGPYEARATTTSLPVACGFTLQTVTATVVDSGLQSLASDVCTYLQQWFRVSDAAVANGKALTSALARLRDDNQALSKDSVSPDIDKLYGKDWSTMQADYQTELTASQKTPMTCVQRNTVQVDANTVRVDHNQIMVDDNTLRSDLYGLTNDIASSTRDIQAAQQALSAYRSVTADSSGGLPVLSFTLDDATAAIAKTQGLLDTANSIVQTAHDKASAYDRNAAALDQQAKNLAASLSC